MGDSMDTRQKRLLNKGLGQFGSKPVLVSGMVDVVDVAGTYRRCLRVNYDIKKALLKVVVYTDAEAAWVKVFPVDPARLGLHCLGDG